MLREGDFFEVILNPGADKREKGILGQITLNALYLLGPGDTGGASLSAVVVLFVALTLARRAPVVPMPSPALLSERQ